MLNDNAMHILHGQLLSITPLEMRDAGAAHPELYEAVKRDRASVQCHGIEFAARGEVGGGIRECEEYAERQSAREDDRRKM